MPNGNKKVNGYYTELRVTLFSVGVLMDADLNIWKEYVIVIILI